MNTIEVGSPAQQSQVIQVLLAQRERLVQEIARIDRFIEQEGFAKSATEMGPSIRMEYQPATNVLSKSKTLKKVLEEATRPMTPRDIVMAMQKLGYHFASRDPGNSLNPYLYGQRRLPFLVKLVNGFILAGREHEFETQNGVETSAIPAIQQSES